MSNAACVDAIDGAGGVTLTLGDRTTWVRNQRPRVDLVLAIPRPLRLEKLLPVVSCVGVGTLVLTGASKVQKDYFGKCGDNN